jgi:hypothetical protein
MVAATVLVLLTVHGAFGQSAASATFTGRALDPQGASVPGATITAINVETAICFCSRLLRVGLSFQMLDRSYLRFDSFHPWSYWHLMK